MFGVELVPTELASMPLMRTLFEVVRCPLTEMTASPRPSSVLFETLEEVPEQFPGYIWTNRIEVIGPALGRGNWAD